MIGVVTTLILAIRVGELSLDPFIGNFIDKTNTRWGKFKPWILLGTLANSLVLFLLVLSLLEYLKSLTDNDELAESLFKGAEHCATPEVQDCLMHCVPKD